MQRLFVALGMAAALAIVAVVALLTMSSTSLSHDGSATLVVRNALRASDLTDVRTITGPRTIDAQGCWAIETDDGAQPLVAPGGARLSEGDLLVGSERFSAGDEVELQGGTGPGDGACGGADAVYFWQIRAAD